MTRIEAYKSGRVSEIPSSWTEMTPAQIRFAFRLYGQCASPLEFNVRMLYKFLGIRMHRPKGNTAENVYLLCEQCLGFLFEEENGVARLALDTISNPLPSVGRRHGPADLLQDLTFGEFRAAAMAVQAFGRSHEASDLDDCIGILYRSRCGKTNRAGRHAAPMSGRNFDRDRRAAARMRPWQKNLVLAWFCRCLQYLQTEKLLLNGEEVDLSLLFAPDGSGSKGPAVTWNDLLVQLAKDQTIGNIDRVDGEPLFSVLQILWSNYKEAKRYEASVKAQKTH